MSVEVELTIMAVSAIAIVVGLGALAWLAVEAAVWLVLRTAEHLTK